MGRAGFASAEGGGGSDEGVDGAFLFLGETIQLVARNRNHVMNISWILWIYWIWMNNSIIQSRHRTPTQPFLSSSTAPKSPALGGITTSIDYWCSRRSRYPITNCQFIWGIYHSSPYTLSSPIWPNWGQIILYFYQAFQLIASPSIPALIFISISSTGAAKFSRKQNSIPKV